MSPAQNSIYIRASIARIYIVLGVLFIFIFLMGAVVLKDFTNILLALSSVFLVVIGVIALRSPYANFNDNSLIIYNFMGKIRIQYTFNNKNDVKVKNNHLYFSGEKMKISKSFVNKEEWKRLINFYSEDSQLMSELQD